jgi:hypothetical protein
MSLTSPFHDLLLPMGNGEAVPLLLPMLLMMGNGEAVPLLLRSYIVIEFDDYCGPKYFTKPGQEKWVPIEPETAKWGGQSEQDHFRKQFPITLAYALTVWKCQGLTIKGLVAVSLGESEKEHGLTFVALSRATDIKNVYLGNGASFQRFQKIGDMPKLIRRVVEDGRLLQNEVETKEHFGTT